jgi:isochorismate pyruvate lyase
VEFQRTYSGAPWEDKFGYCRGIRAGDRVFINGTVAVTDDGQTYAPNDAYAQTKRCFEIAEKALKDLGSDFSRVVRTRIFVTDIGRIDEYGRAHEELFGKHRPCMTLFEVAALARPDMVVEIEIDAFVA